MNTTVADKLNITMSDDYIISTPDVLQEATESLGITMYKHMKIHKDKIAQIDAKTGQKDTYGDLLQRCIRTALHMSNKKITRDDIVTLCTRNHLNCAVPYIASQFIGTRVASIDPSFSVPEMRYLLELVKPKIIFTIPESAETIETVLKDISLDCEIVVFGPTSKHTRFSDFIQHHQKEEEFEPVKIENLKDTAVIHFSSGSTGMPKGICLSHYTFVGQMLNAMHTDHKDFEYLKAQASRLSFPLTMLGYTSLYWLSAGVVLMTSIMEGNCRLLCEDFDGKEVWNLIQKYKPLVLMLTPIQAMEMLANPKPKDVDVDSILTIIIIGSSISKEYTLKLQENFPKAANPRGYGQTEVCGPLTLFKMDDSIHREIMNRPEKIESVGLPVRGTSYKIVDLDTGKNLGPNQRGELRIKNKFIMNGYFNADSSDSFDEDGWLKTGDMMYYDEDFCFYVVDRIREAFKYKGWFIPPTLLENELLNHPAVKQAVVLGIKQDDGYHAMGLVVVNDGFVVTEEEIEKFVESRVSERLRLRAGVRFVEAIPLTVTGKVKRREIRERVLDELKKKE